MSWTNFQICAACVTTCKAVTWHNRRAFVEYVTLGKKYSSWLAVNSEIYSGLYNLQIKSLRARGALTGYYGTSFVTQQTVRRVNISYLKHQHFSI